jgi:hypothetical protein
MVSVINGREATPAVAGSFPGRLPGYGRHEEKARSVIDLQTSRAAPEAEFGKQLDTACSPVLRQ